MSKNKSSKRFGARYGSKIRKNVDEAEAQDYECPECEGKLGRESAGIWKCTKCDLKVAGGAYRRDTGAEETLTRALQVETEELESAKELIEEGEEQ